MGRRIKSGASFMIAVFADAFLSHPEFPIIIFQEFFRDDGSVFGGYRDCIVATSSASFAIGNGESFHAAL